MKNIKITIKQIEGREGEYIAFSKSEFLKATFSVFFNDSVYGSLALVDFSEMLKRKVTTQVAKNKFTCNSDYDINLNGQKITHSSL